jgi:glucose/mannose-6-phosphate isomerase
MPDLDDSNLYDTLDPEGMGTLVAGFADQCRAAWRNVANFGVPPHYRQAEQLLILGMGGSAIGGDLLRTLVAAECPVPIVVSREYDVPAWVGAKTLAIACSHSGNTEETLDAFEQARVGGAMLLAITTGGELERRAREIGATVLRFEFKSQPRAALGYSFVSLLGVVSRSGWIGNPTRELELALTGVEELGSRIGRHVPTAQNPAKRLAQELFERLPVVYGSGVLGEVAHRWKTQFNENAKMTACYDLMSELNHNAVVGYEFPPTVLTDAVFVSLISNRADTRIIKRFNVTQELLRRRGLRHETVQVKGDNALSEMLWGMHFGDYVSFYLAMLNGVKPTPVLAIDFLKDALKG